MHGIATVLRASHFFPDSARAILIGDALWYETPMYSVADYGRMVACDLRRNAYIAALREVVRPGVTVLDLGAGTGFFSLCAASLGAKHVVAIEKNPAIAVAHQAAASNGFADRITVLHARIEDAEIPDIVRDGVDVVVSDLRGMLPLNAAHLAATHLAKTKWLAPGGVLIPVRDRLFVAGVESPVAYARLTRGFTQEALGVAFDPSAGRIHAVNDTYQDHGAHGDWIPAGALATNAELWATLVHGDPPPPRFDSAVKLTSTRACTLHGYAVWFEATLFGAHGFSTAPGNELPYGRAFLPLERPIAMRGGEAIDLRISALASHDDYVLSWQTNGLGCSLAQSTLFRGPNLR